MASGMILSSPILGNSSTPVIRDKWIWDDIEMEKKGLSRANQRMAYIGLQANGVRALWVWNAGDVAPEQQSIKMSPSKILGPIGEEEKRPIRPMWIFKAGRIDDLVDCEDEELKALEIEAIVDLKTLKPSSEIPPPPPPPPPVEWSPVFSRLNMKAHEAKSPNWSRFKKTQPTSVIQAAGKKLPSLQASQKAVQYGKGLSSPISSPTATTTSLSPQSVSLSSTESPKSPLEIARMKLKKTPNGQRIFSESSPQPASPLTMFWEKKSPLQRSKLTLPAKLPLSANSGYQNEPLCATKVSSSRSSAKVSSSSLSKGSESFGGWFFHTPSAISNSQRIYPSRRSTTKE